MEAQIKPDSNGLENGDSPLRRVKRWRLRVRQELLCSGCESLWDCFELLIRIRESESPRKNMTLARLSAGGATLTRLRLADADKKPRVRECWTTSRRFATLSVGGATLAKTVRAKKQV
ncbi:hypothetical protein DU53_11850 [Kosmotoga sp. DU53]|nr:hypothetical protein DU53_11850 [Kosmotoga sp. DU53]